MRQAAALLLMFVLLCFRGDLFCSKLKSLALVGLFNFPDSAFLSLLRFATVPAPENEKQSQGNHHDGPNCLAADADVRELHSVGEDKTIVA